MFIYLTKQVTQGGYFMKFIKKIGRSSLLILALALSFPLTANAAIPNVYPPIKPSTDAYTSTHAYAENGTFYINSGSLEVRNNLNYNAPAVANYYRGESFNYGHVVEVSDYNHYLKNRYASYVSYSGARRYVYFMTVYNFNTNPVRQKMANYEVW